MGNHVKDNSVGETRTLSRKELAAEFNVSLITIDRLLASKQISCYRFGRTVRFGQHHIDEYRRKCEDRAAA